MIWTVPVSSGIADLLLRHGRQRKAETPCRLRDSARARCAAMRLHDGARDRQADAHAVAFGGDERLEQLRGDLRRDAGSAIGDADAHANGACVLAAAPMQAAFQPFVALVLAAYSVGSHTEGPRAVLTPSVLAVAAVPLFVVAIAQGQDPGNAIPSYVWMVAAWGVATVRSWRQKALALEQANAELAEQRELLAQTAVTLERGRIAREIHDVIAHNVSMMVVQAGAAGRVLEGEQPRVRTALDVIATTGRQTVDEMRTLLGVIRVEGNGAARDPQPGLADLDQLVTGVQEAGLPVTVRVEGERRRLPPTLDLSAFRIVQEGLTNALKHAGPARAEVTVRYADESLEVEVVDTGALPVVDRSHGRGHGLIGMRERVAMFGGDLYAAPGATGGFVIRARLPLAPS